MGQSGCETLQHTSFNGAGSADAAGVTDLCSMELCLSFLHSLRQGGNTLLAFYPILYHCTE